MAAAGDQAGDDDAAELAFVELRAQVMVAPVPYWGLWCARRSWRAPAGESPARVRP